MKKLFPLVMMIIISSCVNNTIDKGIEIPSSGPIGLHPTNPHYFLYKGQALALVTSAEHYGAVLNLDFDYKKYLATLSEQGMNYTRIFSGSYFEIYGESFGIKNNPLAPKTGRVITPWTTVILDRSGNIKYDLSDFNEAYFERLKDFIGLANEYEIIVEVTLFSSIYNDALWNINPQNPVNNINIDHPIDRLDAQTINNRELLSLQENLVRKIVTELNDYDNIFFEIQNEPWADHGVPVYDITNKENTDKKDWTIKCDFPDKAAIDWNLRMAGVIKDTEKELPKKHLIALNYCNFKAPVPELDEIFSILNFHYAWPEAVEWNYHFNRVLGFDESGFAGSEDIVYRRQGWQFIMSGGGLFNNLDYSFYPGSEDGTGENTAPGGGSTKLRKELRFLSEFINSFDLENFRPSNHLVVSSPGLIPYILADKGDNYAIYLRAIGTERTRLELETGEGSFSVVFLNTLNGEYSEAVTYSAEEGRLSIEVLIPDGELALKIQRIK